MHCVNACSAIHSFFLAKVNNGTDAGFWAGQTNGCVRAERDRHSLLQNRAEQKAELLEVGAEQETAIEEPAKGVEQYMHDAEAACRL